METFERERMHGCQGCPLYDQYRRDVSREAFGLVMGSVLVFGSIALAIAICCVIAGVW